MRIYRTLVEWRSLKATHFMCEWVNSESFWYLGSNYRLLLVNEQNKPLELKSGRLCLLQSIVETRAGARKAHGKHFKLSTSRKDCHVYPNQTCRFLRCEDWGLAG
jgi:hypothetical protein